MIYTPKPKGESNRQLAQKIAQAIEMSPLNNKEIAKRCGVTAQAVNGWKTTGRISKELLSVFAGVVELPLSYFMEGAGVQDQKGEAGNEPVNTSKMIEVIRLFAESTSAGQDFIVDSARRAEKRGGPG